MATKKATTKKAATASKTKATEPKKAAASEKSKAVTAKKAAPAKKATTAKKAVAKKEAPKKKAATTTEKSAVKETPTAKKKAAPKKAAAKTTVAKTSVKATAAAKTTAKPAASKKRSDTTTRKKKKKEEKQVIAIREVRRKKPSRPEEKHDRVMEKYRPGTRSLLTDPDENTGSVFRYSDEDLAEFKEIILNRLDNARKELVYLQGLITRKDEAGTEDTDNRFNHMEDGSAAMEREQISQLAGRQIQFISHLENALVRIENKTYGICRVTGKLISKERLRAVPHATLSIEAKKMRK